MQNLGGGETIFIKNGGSVDELVKYVKDVFIVGTLYSEEIIRFVIHGKYEILKLV